MPAPGVRSIEVVRDYSAFKAEELLAKLPRDWPVTTGNGRVELAEAHNGETIRSRLDGFFIARIGKDYDKAAVLDVSVKRVSDFIEANNKQRSTSCARAGLCGRCEG